MNLSEYRNIQIGDEVETTFGGIGIVAERYPKCVQILNWINLTPKDANHCSFYDLNELKCKHISSMEDV